MGALYSSVITFTATEVGLFLRESNYYSRIETVTNYLLQLSVITPADCDSHLQELPSPHRVHKQQIQEGVLNTVHLYRQSAIFNDTIKWQKIYIYLYTLFLFVCFLLVGLGRHSAVVVSTQQGLGFESRLWVLTYSLCMCGFSADTHFLPQTCLSGDLISLKLTVWGVSESECLSVFER